MEYTIGLDWIIIIITFIITLGAQGFINAKYSQTKNIKSKKGLTGREVARKILNKNGLENIEVIETSGVLSDHYDPRKKVIRLSSDVYNNTSLASASVAAHEVGHAIQDKNGYSFLRIRNNIIPLVNFSSSAGYIAIIIGLFSGSLGFLWLGIIFEIVILLFQVITLPVEFDASSRALTNLQELEIVDQKEIRSCRGMLTAAALTYVASVATSLLEIMRLVMMTRRDDDR